MRKRKGFPKKLVLGIGIALVVLLLAGYLAMDLAVKQVLKAVAGDMPALPSTTASPTGKVAGKGAEAGVGGQPGIEAGGQPTPKGNAAGGAGSPSGQPAEVGQQKAEAGSGSSSGVPGSASPASPTPGSSAPSSPPGSSSSGYDGTVSTDKAAKAQEQISLKEKTMITSVFLKRLSSEDMKLFMQLAGDGLSLEEKKAAKKIILQKLTEDEYDQLIQIAAKLGLSQGKSYQDSKKQMGIQ
ncbi:hypothetical protein J31TS4_32470 [Paenibacillus sp. J31TS4]|uniref:hypothetical protein n=1 Tax=Paenibacillus sp. J31TS4 TaxID=2807195 RepID=UPI001B078D78|nr:hypothetical protein [Paenibacillus sp. J31TS4]GIP39967.1 hypothetical protein J31TS4_32470 [Paenibacillus sp. J31TS4]